MVKQWEYPCKDEECTCITCSRQITVFDAPYEKRGGAFAYPGMCYHLSPPETFEIPASEFESYLRDKGNLSVENISTTSGQHFKAKVTSSSQNSNSHSVTKKDLHMAVKKILRGEDTNINKPGPKLTAAKKRQIEAAQTYLKSHAGCTLHNACLRSFEPVKHGYKNPKSMYRALLRKNKPIANT